MSPLGKPGPAGTVVSAGRHYGGAATLGVATVWTCPACGGKVEGRLIEQGCPTCGAGDPLKGQAGMERTEGAREAAEYTNKAVVEADTTQPAPSYLPTPPRLAPQAQVTRIVRLLEYLIAPGQDATDILRRSLVGTLQFPWGQLTGTIVDSVDLNQEDRLRVAKLQPGVWLARERALELQPQHPTLLPVIGAVGRVPDRQTILLTDAEKAAIAAHYERKAMPTPDVGMPFTETQQKIAGAIADLGGYRLTYTLALALQGIAEELNASSEPEKFLSSQEALQLATALLDRVPSEWLEGQEPDAQQPTLGDA